MKVETFIRKTMNWHTVYFKIWVQTFALMESEREDKNNWSLKMARWHKKMLDVAFNNLTKEQWKK